MITYIASVCMETNNASASRDEGMRRVTYYVHRQLYSYPVKSKSRSIGRSIKRGQSAAQNTAVTCDATIDNRDLAAVVSVLCAHCDGQPGVAQWRSALLVRTPWSGSLFRGPGPCSYDQIDVEIFTNPLINFCSNT